MLKLAGSLSACSPVAVSPILSAYCGFAPAGQRAALVIESAPEPDVSAFRNSSAAAS